jgi:hypothetical protein
MFGAGTLWWAIKNYPSSDVSESKPRRYAMRLVYLRVAEMASGRRSGEINSALDTDRNAKAGIAPKIHENSAELGFRGLFNS